MSTRKLVIAFRYMAIFILIADNILLKRASLENNFIIFIFLYMINSQIRFFSLQRTLSLFLSLCLELVGVILAYGLYGGTVLPYFFITVMDATYLLNGWKSYFLSGTAVSLSAYLSLGKGPWETISTVWTLMIASVFLYYIKNEYEDKVKAQEFYDKLRISEDKLKRVNEELEMYARSIEELTTLRERNRISRELHDSIGHSLSTMVIQLGAIEQIAKENGQAAAHMAAKLGEYARKSLQEVRNAVREMKPREFEMYEGILAVEDMINNFKKLTGVEVRLGFSKEKWTLNSDQSFVIYRVVQEFLSNSLRHGQATRVNIFMDFGKEDLTMTLEDNGKGADLVEKGVGLKSIWERVGELGGSAEYNSKKGQGFMIKIKLKAKYVIV